jgi:hypothetical protein
LPYPPAMRAGSEFVFIADLKDGGNRDRVRRLGRSLS